jgi:predicted MPP superfamily phosphohydrolase
VADGNGSHADAVSRMNVLRRCLESLEVGARRPLLVRRESLTHLRQGKRILFASDLHLRRDGPQPILDGILQIASRENPDVILLGGDLVDSSKGLPFLMQLIGNLAPIAPVAAIAGNHDRWIGLARVRQAVLEAGGYWLEDKPLHWAPEAAAYGRLNDKLLPVQFHVLCSHDPRPPAIHGRFDLVLSGHLHGGQFVFFEHDGRLYPGALLYRWNGLRFRENGSTLLVSRGVRDTLPLRWNCPREVIVVDL